VLAPTCGGKCDLQQDEREDQHADENLGLPRGQGALEVDDGLDSPQDEGLEHTEGEQQQDDRDEREKEREPDASVSELARPLRCAVCRSKP